jgi:hypothetical protein
VQFFYAAMRDRQLDYDDTKKKITTKVADAFKSKFPERKMQGECTIDHQSRTIVLKVAIVSLKNDG